MVAPLDAKATFEVEGEAITLRLNFRTIALAEEEGIDLFGGVTELPLSKAAIILKCLAVQEHPEWTEDHAIAAAMANPQGMGEALIELFAKYGGKADEGNAKRRKARA